MKEAQIALTNGTIAAEESGSNLRHITQNRLGLLPTYVIEGWLYGLPTAHEHVEDIDFATAAALRTEYMETLGLDSSTYRFGWEENPQAWLIKLLANAPQSIDPAVLDQKLGYIRSLIPPSTE